jgi:arginyl-tRNA synthetase
MSDSVCIVVREILRKAVEAVHADGLIPDVPAQILFERPKRAEHGDYATNIALNLAKSAGKPPRGLGDAIAAHAREIGGADLSEVTVAGLGFVNLRFSGIGSEPPRAWRGSRPFGRCLKSHCPCSGSLLRAK